MQGCLKPSLGPPAGDRAIADLTATLFLLFPSLGRATGGNSCSDLASLRVASLLRFRPLWPRFVALLPAPEPILVRTSRSTSPPPPAATRRSWHLPAQLRC